MAVKKPKPQALAVPQNDDEANKLLADYGTAFNALARLAVELDEDLAAAKAGHETAAKPLQAIMAEIATALEAYGAANRRRLTNGGAIKTVAMPAGAIGWRTNPPSVKFARGVKAEDIVDELKRMRLIKFLRRTLSVNKEAMLDDPEKANTVPGVKILTDVETFFVAPFGAELAEPKS